MSSSPTNVDTPLEYITIEAYAWPKPERAKRFRQDDEMRELRRRENQRRFVARKQARIAVLRREVEFMELQFKYLQALQEEQTLRQEQRQFEREDDAKETDLQIESFEPLDVRCDGEPMELDAFLTEVLSAL